MSITIPLQQLMIDLFDANPEQVQAAVREYGTLSVRLAMLGVASSKREANTLYYGYPPGVFISYKWDGEAMKQYVMSVASHLRSRGYRAFLDVEELSADADDYSSVPQYISSIQECVYYVLLLTEKTASYITARHGQTSWIFDEYQHAIRLQTAGRLIFIPLLLEEEGTTDFFTRDIVVDMTKNWDDFTQLDQLLRPNPASLTKEEQTILQQCVDEFDGVFLQEKFPEALAVLLNHQKFDDTFDYQFRLMLFGIYTANQDLANRMIDRLQTDVGGKVLAFLYSGYCKRHNIPNQMTAK